MQNGLKVNMNRVFKCDAKTLYQAIGEGALFKYTGALMSKSKFDFQEGGAIELFWIHEGKELQMTGKFTRLRPHDLIGFTWNTAAAESGKRMDTLVLISIHEKNGVSTLTLDHTGFESLQDCENHNWGWDDALQDLYKSLRDAFAKAESSAAGLDLKFKMKKTISAPQAQVFQAVQDKDELRKYFQVQASDSLREGKEVAWKFEDLDKPLTLQVHQVIQNELIKFQWGTSHVCFSFRPMGPDRTEVVIDVAAGQANQANLEDSYSECDGWMEFLVLLRFHFERK